MTLNGIMNRADFNPYTQNITLLAADQTPIPVAISDIDDYVNYGVSICINYGSQIGASILLLVCLLFLTRPDKRTTAVFVLNALALLFNTIRSICQCIFFTGAFYEFYNFFAGDYSNVPTSQYGASIAGIVFTFFLVACLEASLVLQVHVILTNPSVRRLHRRLLVAISALIALLATAFRFALMVQNSIAVRQAVSFSPWQWLAATSMYITTASICFFSAVFVAKLAFALHRRHHTLGMRQFGPMEIVFIMGCQTLVVPAVFAVLQTTTDVPELGSQVLTVTALFLPLSSLWAAASVEQPAQGPEGKRGNVTGKKAWLGTREMLRSWRSGGSSSMASSRPKSDIEMGKLPDSAALSSVATPAKHERLDKDGEDDLEKDLRMYSGRGPS